MQTSSQSTLCGIVQGKYQEISIGIDFKISESGQAKRGGRKKDETAASSRNYVNG